MKKMIYTGLSVALVIVLQSCGSKGWTTEAKESAHKICKMGMDISYPDDSQTICDCYIGKLAEKYPKADQTPDQSTALMDECSADAKKKADAEFERKMNESMQSLEESIDNAGEKIDEAADAVKEKVEEVKK
jgi:hypothetical protein